MVRRTIDWLFPQSECRDPERDAEEFDVVVTTKTQVKVGWRDLARLCVTRRIVVETKTSAKGLIELGPQSHAFWVEGWGK